MRRSLALVAVGVAVAVAAGVVIAGVSSGGETGGSSPDTAETALPEGHPSIDGGEAGRDDGGQTAVAQASGGGGVKDLEARRDADPGDARVLVDLGQAYFMAQRLGDAEKAYTQALELRPGSAPARIGLAMVWHAQGDSDRAEEALRAVLKDHPDDQEAHYSLAIVYFSDGQIDAARDEWQTAAGIDPSTITGRRSRSFVDLLDDGQSGSPHSAD